MIRANYFWLSGPIIPQTIKEEMQLGLVIKG